MDASSLLAVAPLETLSGKFQISDGVGPTDVKAVVAAPGDQTSDGASDSRSAADSSGSVSPVVFEQTSMAQSGADAGEGGGDSESNQSLDQSPTQDSSPAQAQPRVASSQVLCLIDKGEAVYPGQSGTVVLRGQSKDNVLALPVSAVAGRLQKGSVTLVQGDQSSAVDVGLGVSDGAYIEITSGLKQGDTVSSVAPYLDPRKK